MEVKNMHYNKLNKWTKRGIAFSSDTSGTIISWIGAIWLSSSSILDPLDQSLIIKVSCIQCVVYIACGLYRGIWRFASLPDLVRILRAVFIGTVITLLYLRLNHLYIPIKVYIIYLLLLIAILSGSRLLFRWSRDYPKF